MKRLKSLLITLGLAALTTTSVVGCKHMDSEDHAGAGMHHHQYTCKMHPEVVQDTPGNCPKCGMKLVHKD